MAALPDFAATPIALCIAANEDRAGRAAFELAYTRHAPRIHRFLRDLLGDAALASDATQETFARAFKNLAMVRDTERALPWLFGVARNVSLELRKARFRSQRLITQENETVDHARAPSSATPEAELLGRETVRVVDRALSRLTVDRRAALLLRLDHGLAYDDIAELMGWSLAKVKVEIFRAREVLRATVAEYQRGETHEGRAR